MGSCPTCGSVVEAARSRHVRIVGARVLTFCSAACVEGGSARAHESPDPQARPQSVIRVVPPTALRPDIHAGDADGVEDADAPWLDDDDLITLETHAFTDFARKPGRRKSAVLMSALATVLGLSLVVADGTSTTSPVPSVAAAGVPTEEARPTLPAASRAPELTERQRATQTLRDLANSHDRRIRRVATLALVRAGDKAAAAQLGEFLGAGDSTLAKLAIAEAQAKLGDTDAVAYLHRALDKGYRDVRVEAARALAGLGEARGFRQLRRVLKYKHYRVEAAVALAMLGAPEGIEVLEKMLRGAKTTEERMRAAVSLGRAGQMSALSALRRIADSGEFNVGAAAALAVLGDARGVATLKTHLPLAGTRIEAARALATLGASVDTTELLLALDRDDEVGRITAAAALLVVTPVDR